MSKINAWKTPVYLQDKTGVDSNPAGNSIQELKSMELDNYVGAGTANSYCNCYTNNGSCGHLCTFTTECPFLTIVCC